MTMWHFLMAYAVLVLVNWVGVIRGIKQTDRAVASMVAPVLAAFVWVFGLWMDWDRGFFDQGAWIILGHAALLVALLGLAVKTATASRRSPPP